MTNLLKKTLHIYRYAKENNFSAAQISVHFAIFKSILENFIGKLLYIFLYIFIYVCLKSFIIAAGASLPTVLTEFQKLVLAHTSCIGDHWDIFSIQESKLILDYGFTTFFQHFNLYQYAFTKEQEADELVVSKSIEKNSLTLAPLSEALTLEAYESELGKINENEGLQQVPEELNEQTIERKLFSSFLHSILIQFTSNFITY
jgi:hypothetical protein